MPEIAIITCAHSVICQSKLPRKKKRWWKRRNKERVGINLSDLTSLEEPRKHFFLQTSVILPMFKIICNNCDEMDNTKAELLLEIFLFFLSPVCVHVGGDFRVVARPVKSHIIS